MATLLMGPSPSDFEKRRSNLAQGGREFNQCPNKFGVQSSEFGEREVVGAIHESPLLKNIRLQW